MKTSDLIILIVFGLPILIIFLYFFVISPALFFHHGWKWFRDNRKWVLDMEIALFFIIPICSILVIYLLYLIYNYLYWGFRFYRKGFYYIDYLEKNNIDNSN